MQQKSIPFQNIISEVIFKVSMAQVNECVPWRIFPSINDKKYRIIKVPCQALPNFS